MDNVINDLNIELFILRFAFFGFYIHIENNAKKVTDILKTSPYMYIL